jgi:MOSC domain-containing protein YiiM
VTAGAPPRAGQVVGAAGTIVSINISRQKGRAKTPVPRAQIIAGEGIREDAHRGFGNRQVSLLMIESIEEQAARLGGAAATALGPGAYAENLTTRGLDLKGIKVGDELLILAKSMTVRLRVSQIGKECHTRCAIYKIAGDCIMPALGIFCEVLEGGTVKSGDRIERR